jgi:DNA-binding protein H-NS
MSNELNNEEGGTPILARLQDGEPVIPKLSEESQAAIKELVNKYQESVDQLENATDVESIVEEITEEPVAEEQVSAKAEPKPSKPKTSKKKDEDKIVAVFSTKNVTWNGVGKVYRGYNIVTQEEADLWATRSHIRVATPEEVAKEFGL